MTVAEVAELFKLNQQTVRNWIDAGALPAVRVGSRRVRVRESDLEHFIAVSSAVLPKGSVSPAHREEVPADAVGVARDRFREALRRADQTLADDEPGELVQALRTLSEAATSLADRLSSA